MDIQFYLNNGAFNYIMHAGINNAPNQHTSEMRGLRISNAINVFVVSNIDFVGAAAYFQNPSGWDGNDFIVIDRSFVYAENVLPHEIGHFFSLLHPFHGWENNAWNENQWGNPVGTNAPSDPTIFPDDILNEKQDGSNCTQAGDLICDTPPDYLFAQHPQQNNCNPWALDVKDPANMTVDPMENNIMSYFSACTNYDFTNDQKAAIKNDLMFAANRDYVRNSFTPDLTQINTVPTLIFPNNGSAVSNAELVVLQWIPLFEAEYYLVEIDISESFVSPKYKSQVVAASVPTAIFENLQGNATYFWRVRPFSQYYTCTGLSDRWEFTTPPAVSVKEIEAINAWQVFPNPLNAGAAIQLEVNAATKFDGDILVYNAAGKVIHRLPNFQFQSGSTFYQLPIELKTGLYFLSIQNGAGVSNQRIVVL